MSVADRDMGDSRRKCFARSQYKIMPRKFLTHFMQKLCPQYSPAIEKRRTKARFVSRKHLCGCERRQAIEDEQESKTKAGNIARGDDGEDDL